MSWLPMSSLTLSIPYPISDSCDTVGVSVTLSRRSVTVISRFNPVFGRWTILHLLVCRTDESISFSVPDDGLKIFKLYEHPEIRPQIEVMKTEVMKYQALAGSIKPFEERKDSKGKDMFDLSDWWKSNCATLPGFTYVLRAVLTNSPNSCPPERLFSIFNAACDDDQKRSHADYIELSIQSQFNKRVM